MLIQISVSFEDSYIMDFREIQLPCKTGIVGGSDNLTPHREGPGSTDNLSACSFH